MRSHIIYLSALILLMTFLLGCAFYQIDFQKSLRESLIVVAPSGGDFTSVNSALKYTCSLPEENTITVLVMPGIYNENDVNIRRGNILLKGTDPTRCIIQGKPRNIHLVHIYNPQKDIKNITIEGLTLKNLNKWGEYNTRAQEALAVGFPSSKAHRVTQVTIRDCHLFGYQDTSFVYPNSEAVFIDCLIDGGYDIASLWRSQAYYLRCKFIMHHPKGAGALYVDKSKVGVWDCYFESEHSADHMGALDLQSSDATIWFFGNKMGKNITHSIYLERNVKPTKKTRIFIGGNRGKKVACDPVCK
ncbi:hypothetical protein J7M23_08605, partial [Candidatus Sumerlaeota bacterium]|nr:hypothetical protein [Candidatus Sumerlaeota bacterium]